MPPLGQIAADTASPRGKHGTAGRDKLVDEELLLLREATRLLGKPGDPGIAIREMLHLLSELLGLNRGRVVLPDAGRDTLSIRYAYGLTAAEVALGRYRTGEGVAGRVMATGEMHVVQDIAAEASDQRQAFERAARPQETTAFIALPIFDPRGVAGVLAAHRVRGRRRACADDVRVLEAVATLIGHLLHLQALTQRLDAGRSGMNRAGTVPAREGDAVLQAEAVEAPGRIYQRVAAGDRQRIEQALAHAGGNKSRAAQMLGLTLRQFNYRYKVLGVG